MTPEPAGPGAVWSSRLAAAVVAGLYAFPLILAIRPIDSPDIWWHMRAGQWIVAHRTVPWADPFSRYPGDQPFIASSWLYEVVLYGLHGLAGPWGLVLFTMAGWLASMAAVHALVRMSRVPALTELTLLTAWAAILARFMTPRSWFFSIVLLVVELHVVRRATERGDARLLWSLPPLFAFWATVHIVFVYGLAVLGLACAGEVFEALTADERGPALRAARPLVVATLASTLATLANPYHLRLYEAVLSIARGSKQYEYITELQAPHFRDAWDWTLLGLTLTAAVALGRLGRVKPFTVLCFGFAAVLSFRSVHDSWLVALVAITIIAAARPCSSTAVTIQAPPRTWATVGMLALLAVVAVGVWRGDSEAALIDRARRVYPVDAAAVVKARGYPGPLYNHYDWGGYLMWALPHLRVSMDGRANMHGDDRVMRSLATWGGAPDWPSDEELGASRLVIANRVHALTTLLRGDRRFELVYEDAVAAVFVAKAIREMPRGETAALRGVVTGERSGTRREPGGSP